MSFSRNTQDVSKMLYLLSKIFFPLLSSYQKHLKNVMHCGQVTLITARGKNYLAKAVLLHCGHFLSGPDVGRDQRFWQKLHQFCISFWCTIRVTFTCLCNATLSFIFPQVCISNSVRVERQQLSFSPKLISHQIYFSSRKCQCVSKINFADGFCFH